MKPQSEQGRRASRQENNTGQGPGAWSPPHPHPEKPSLRRNRAGPAFVAGQGGLVEGEEKFRKL